MNSHSWRIDNEDGMIEFGRQLAAALPSKALLLLSGNLGAGKTTLTKGIAEGLGAARADDVSSPTFTLIHEYGDPVRLYHIDLYRLEEERQLATLGLDEMLDRNAVAVIEWPDKFLQWLPARHYRLELVHDGDARIVTIYCPADAPDLPAILSTAFLQMDEHSSSEGFSDTFALVAYIPGSLATFLDDLRRRLDPGSEPNAHVTLLPPRRLNGTVDEARQQIREGVASVRSFPLDLGTVDVFETTNVVYLSLGQGRCRLADIHNTLNTSVLKFPEPHEYYPHITLVQFQPGEKIPAIAEEIRALWAAYAGPRQFTVSKLIFVKHMGGNTWLDLESFDLLD